MQKNYKEFDLWITKAGINKETGEMRWSCVGSDTQPDSFEDEMSIPLFKSFTERIDKSELAPEKYRTDFWQGGMPYLSLSHFSDGNGESVPGMPEEVFIDGNRLKSNGTFDDNPLGKACFEAVKDSVQKVKSGVEDFDPVRISIGFLDFKHEHKSDGSIFLRSNIDDGCEQCMQEKATGTGKGLKFLDGQLIHLALTRKPVNERTSMEVERSMTTRKEDAASIVGEELADEIEKKEKELADKTKALVVKSDEPETGSEDAASEVSEKTEKANLTLAEALQSMERSDEAWKIQDIFWMLSDVVWDIAFSESGKEAFSSPEEMKSAVSSAIDEARDMITRSMFVMETKNLVETKEAPVETSAVEKAWIVLKAKLDAADKTDPKGLEALQAEYEGIARALQAEFPAPVEEPKPEIDIQAIVDQAVQKAVSAVVAEQQVAAQPAPVNVQRGITTPNLQVNDPALHQKSVQAPPADKKVSSISQTINKSVGLDANFYHRPGAVVKETG